ncbi:SAGA-associated factor 11 homolog isoform X2 [Homalodisca vitripennis]|uniref:SAGA-associated factor 11 homolog n=1 Tax=Homalodisca liturata TaxID=320908 RepID=A0A1B6I0C9_9HEMI|nr:SAGA-associated factor 11 homolog isoform X2 [Homalodisca vitripennis]XP_046667972.1 SAGA-associated factor 11 homolog isoform X2 [Homalodisca vitripennis]XP_046667980.1 SAGA-associated factor 11 homolog isoform X2 [Homalodisca vitripennis]XP_046667988.1 SAGA-associated factor 11 homolog isoform X2 [Homalodisca vitripennis]XP_046667992.1 SAGA-associated factor 11 homolog isoform X2 [Homalodisca vitripennis]XP_046667999.1 SAGA-associated factor 11 homolog isoform X2 [Homalodisca vitripennis]
MASHNTTAEPCSTEEELIHRVKQLLLVPANVETAVNHLFDMLVEDILLGIVFEVHEVIRQGGIPVTSEEEMKAFAIVENTETDIFGQPYVKKSQECCCPSCNRPLSASRFAPHLEKCLGMGRNSSRIASKRIASNCKENAYGGISDDDDEDWVAGQEKSKLNKKVDSKKKRDKNGVRKNKTQKVTNDKNHSGKVSEDYNQNTKYDGLETKN